MGAGAAEQALTQAQYDAMRNIGLEKLGITQGALSGQPANLGGSTTQPTYSNPLSSALGGAGLGYQLLGGASGSGGVGAGIGALLGLLV